MHTQETIQLALRFLVTLGEILRRGLEVIIGIGRLSRRPLASTRHSR